MGIIIGIVAVCLIIVTANLHSTRTSLTNIESRHTLLRDSYFKNIDAHYQRMNRIDKNIGESVSAMKQDGQRIHDHLTNTINNSVNELRAIQHQDHCRFDRLLNELGYHFEKREAKEVLVKGPGPFSSFTFTSLMSQFPPIADDQPKKRRRRRNRKAGKAA